MEKFQKNRISKNRFLLKMQKLCKNSFYFTAMNLVPLHGIQALSNELKVRRKTITQFATFFHMGITG